VSDRRPGRFEQQIRMVGGRRMQCKDIPDAAFLDAVKVNGRAAGWRTRWEVQRDLESVIGWLPERLFLAKARTLIRRMLVLGCPCGCRGEYEIPEWCADPAPPGAVPVAVPCPGSPCARYLYGAVHQHTELRASGGEEQ
jgi:hypothetical protein